MDYNPQMLARETSRYLGQKKNNLQITARQAKGGEEGTQIKDRLDTEEDMDILSRKAKEKLWAKIYEAQLK